MSLEKWVEYGWLRREATSPDEIKALLGIVDRGVADSKVEAISVDLRFISAFAATLTAATTALRASGHRTATQAGHHIKTIESLEFAVKANSRLIQNLKTFTIREINRATMWPEPYQTKSWKPWSSLQLS
jgi:hypothetical protein